ncbi:MAG: biliverdin-producing heme oxygenase [Verrucomicrobia bacterium]|nr:biliverdin-producing heme oxygenase [Verrucomicrobiota bacterium]
MSPSSLREATRPAHQRLEDRLAAMLETISLAEYRALLARFFGFYHPMEERLAAFADECGLPLRSRTPLLVRDLLALGLPAGAVSMVPLYGCLPELNDPTQALGALYVVEGAALGGQVIAPRLQAQLGVTPENGVAFFYGDGPGTGPRWKAFRQVLAGYPIGDAPAAAQAALQTFESFERWLFPNLPTPGPRERWTRPWT